jgi:hypothetical protein
VTNREGPDQPTQLYLVERLARDITNREDHSGFLNKLPDVAADTIIAVTQKLSTLQRHFLPPGKETQYRISKSVYARPAEVLVP